MDELKLGSSFMKFWLKRIIRKKLKDICGADVEVDVNALSVTFDGNNARAHVAVDASMRKEELEKALGKLF